MILRRFHCASPRWGTDRTATVTLTPGVNCIVCRRVPAWPAVILRIRYRVAWVRHRWALLRLILARLAVLRLERKR